MSVQPINAVMLSDVNRDLFVRMDLDLDKLCG